MAALYPRFEPEPGRGYRPTQSIPANPQPESQADRKRSSLDEAMLVQDERRHDDE